MTFNFFDKLGKKGVWLFTAILALLLFIIFKDFILQEKVLLYTNYEGDMLITYLPNMLLLSEYLHKYGFPSWSFSAGLGQNIFTHSAIDPTDFISCLFQKESIPHILVYKELLKNILGGILFFKYLRLLNLSNYTATIGSLCYSFCGYITIYVGAHPQFSYDFLITPLWLLCFELLFKKNKWWWFCLPVFLFTSKPFSIYTSAIFMLPYILFRIYQTCEKFDTEIVMPLLGKLMGASLIGIGLGAPFLFETLNVMLNSPRGDGTNSYTNFLSNVPVFQIAPQAYQGTGILRLFALDIIGKFTNFHGIGSNWTESQAFYSGLPCLLLIPQLFQFQRKRVRIFSLALLILWLVPLFFQYFRLAFWLFTGDYYRTYNLYVSIVLILLSMLALDNIIKTRKVNLIILVITLSTLLLVVNYPFFPESAVDSNLRLFVMLFLYLYALLLFLIARKKDEYIFNYIFLVVLLFELGYFSYNSICNSNRVAVTTASLKEQIGYNDYTIPSVDFLNKTDSSFYRIDKDYGSYPVDNWFDSQNDARAQNYYGTSSLSSFNHKYYIRYWLTMNVIGGNEWESRSCAGLKNRPILEALNNVKYFFYKGVHKNYFRDKYTQNWRTTHDSIGNFGDVTVLKNKFWLPLGYAHSSYIKLSEFIKLPVPQKDFVSTQTCVVEDEDVTKISAVIPAYNASETNSLQQNIDKLRQGTFQITESNKSTFIKGNIHVPKASMLYLSIPFDESWQVTDNEQPTEKFILTSGMTGVLLSAGNHKIELHYTNIHIRRGGWITFATLLLIGGLYIYKRKLLNNKFLPS
jgi:uncharacterized membrane protein YfhO